jgi:hypothetical protein
MWVVGIIFRTRVSRDALAERVGAGASWLFSALYALRWRIAANRHDPGANGSTRTSSKYTVPSPVSAMVTLTIPLAGT